MDSESFHPPAEASASVPAVGSCGRPAASPTQNISGLPLAGEEHSLSEQPENEGWSLHSIFLGDEGLRAGWSVVLFLVVGLILMIVLATGTDFIVHRVLHIRMGSFTPTSVLLQEFLSVLALVGAAKVVAVVEDRPLVDYNLRDLRGGVHLASGALVGFISLSALVGALTLGGWLHFGPIPLMGEQILVYGALWAAAFAFTGLFEEGVFRCFLQSTLTRGINFWWAFGVIAALCLDLLLRSKGDAVWGVYVAAAAGLVPCVILHLRRSESASFWQAAWVTSTLFGFTHTGNGGENWIGVFAAAAIGFVFCVSIRVTGSAWWAIGFHAAWDWGETYFYGTADSGNVATGHYLSTTTIGSVLWSGGADGPEGSLLIFFLVIVLLLGLIAVYRRTSRNTPTTAAAGGSI